MRINDVGGQGLLKSQPAQAAALFGEAIEIATLEDSTYLAVLHFQRAAARQKAGDRRGADEDIAKALQILHDEVWSALARNPRDASVPLWTPYFSRFRSWYDQLIASRIDANDVEGALVHAEVARAFEPMQILSQSGSLPPGYRAIETVKDLRQAQAGIPDDTVILQFLVMSDRTFVWVVTRETITPVPLRATSADIEGWATDVAEGLKTGQSNQILKAMRAVYGELFRIALKDVRSKTRFVIVPDGPMHGLPFVALRGTDDEGYLLERGSITLSGSTSAYLYQLARDRQLSAVRKPAVLLIGDPAFKPIPELPWLQRLDHAQDEVKDLKRDYYPDATVLMNADATVPRFLAEARNQTIIHFAGHALSSTGDPWESRLLFAPDGAISGELNAQKLLLELPRLDHTRLVVLGACSTAGGGSVGPQGLAPLVRPFLAARVPAVVGTLWDVKDASAKPLLVSLHCHYRNGDDVAVALRKAQLAMLREPARVWAAFQVVGYAGSPYPRPAALEDSNIEHLCTQDSLLRPDGLHSQ
jgi:CHAT domain-containing protein